MPRSFESDANNYSMIKGMNKDDSDSSSGDTIPLFTHLGRTVVPITSTCQELLDAIEKYRGDGLFITEIIRRSTVYFPDSQLVLIRGVLSAAELIRQFGHEQRFVDELKNFEDELDWRIDAEKTFFEQQKKRHVNIYEILRQSSFPYSASQTACFNSMIGALYQLTGDPNSEADKVFESGLRGMVRLLQLDDHLRDPTPHRVVVSSTIHFYLQGMVSKLELLAVEERNRPHPNFIRLDSKVDLASYLVEDLGALVDVTKISTPRDHFHYGMVEIYTRYVEIFKKSGLEFSYIQEVSLQKIERRVRDLRKSPRMGKHHGIVEACLEFMSELEEDNPDREYKLEDDRLVLAPEGENNRAIREISWDLIYLQPIATEHLANFASFGNGVENVVARLMERFLSLYPMH